MRSEKCGLERRLWLLLLTPLGLDCGPSSLSPLSGYSLIRTCVNTDGWKDLDETDNKSLASLPFLTVLCPKPLTVQGSFADQVAFSPCS